MRDLINSGFLEVGDGYRAKNDELGTSGLAFARAGNINDGFKFHGADRYPIERLAKVGRKVSFPGDVVFTSKGTVGRFALVDGNTERFVYSPQLCYWRSLDHEEIAPEFLYYWMQSSECLDQFSYLKGQTDMADYVSLLDQLAMSITLPSIDSQKSVIGTLKPIDDRLATLQHENQNLEALARAIFKSWFVDFDPVRAKAEAREPEGMDGATAALFPKTFVSSPLGAFPDGWQTTHLYEIASFSNGASYKDIHFSPTDEGLPVIKIAELKAGVTTSTRFTEVNLGERHRIEPDEILFSWSGNPDT